MLIDRSVLVVSGKEPFLNWVNNTSQLDKPLVLSDLNDDPSSYLIPPFEGEDEKEAILLDVFEEIFLREMEDWGIEEKHFERDLTLEKFKQWFHIQSSSCPIDLIEGPIEKEDY